MKNLVVTLLLVVGFSNQAIFEKSHANFSDSSGIDVSIVTDSHHSDSTPSESSDCGNKECSHQCHFGHCSFILSENSFQTLPEFNMANFQNLLNFNNIYLNNLFRPPIV